MSFAAVLVSLLMSAHATDAGRVSPDPFPAPPAFDAATLPDGARWRPTGIDGKPHPVEARLLIGEHPAAAGGVVELGIQLAQDEGWHTYWQSPGDVGLPTEITWHLPEGTTLSERTWPIPQRFELAGQVSYGYAQGVVHTFRLQLPAKLSPGTYPISAEVNWLVCQESCIPGQASLKGEILVGDGELPTDASALIDAWSARAPTPLQTLDALTPAYARCATPASEDGTFRAAFALSPVSPHTLGDPTEVPAGLPTAVGISGSADREVTTTLVQTEGGRLIVGIAGSNYAQDEADGPDNIGVLIHSTLDGEPFHTELWQPFAPKSAQIADSDGLCAIFKDLTPPQAPPTLAQAPTVQTPPQGTSSMALAPGILLINLLLAFVGGLILNVMPCVLPVLMLKLYGLVEHSHADAQTRRRHGFAYTAGVLSSFALLAAGIIFARTLLGDTVGWGSQFQEPWYVATLASLTFVFALNLFGVFEVPMPTSSKLHGLTAQDGVAGSFFSGAFATLLSTPCSAPFLGTAIAFAFQAPAGILFVVFLTIGLGLASPFLCIALLPSAQRLLPKPGEWMVVVKQLLGFTLIATTLWLTDVMGSLTGLDGLIHFLGFLATLGLAAWVFGRWGGEHAPTRSRLIATVASVLIVAGGVRSVLSLDLAEDCAVPGEIPSVLSYQDEVPWQAFSEDRLEALAGRVVLVDFTANWCLTCKVNEATVLQTQAIRDLLAEQGVVPLKADWTRRDPIISNWLAKFGRAGVPMVLVVPTTGAQHAILLPEVLTADRVREAVTCAAQGLETC